MTFQNLEPGRIIRAVGLIFIVCIVLSFMTTCFSVMLWPPELMNRLSDVFTQLIDPDTTPEQFDAIQSEMQAINDEYAPEISVQYVLQWSVAALVTFFIARRTAARAATSQPQASGYGFAIGLGAAFTYGVTCVMLISITAFWLRLLYFLALVLAGMFGGQAAASKLGKLPPGSVPSGPKPSGGVPRFEPAGQGLLTRQAAPSGPRPEVYYNMGVTAALGGRRDEARQHFTHVVQMQPRNVAAWLQLANLAESPEQAWNFVQQARAIEPNNPQVKDAVRIIWPQVQSSASRTPSPLQPPYPGAAQDDPGIPEIRLPHVTPPPADMTPPPPPPPEDPEPQA